VDQDDLTREGDEAQEELEWLQSHMDRQYDMKEDLRFKPGSCLGNLSFSPAGGRKTRIVEEARMAEGVYKVIELVGTSSESWEKAAAAAVERASKSLRSLRIAEVSELDMQLEDGKVQTYRAKVKVSFKYEGE
jgi:Uncharacterized conserved protein